MKCKELLEKIDQLKEKYIKVWEDACNIESPTADKAGVDRVGRYFIRMAEEHGWKVEICLQEVSGDAICITMNPDAKGTPISLSGHMDTVHPVGLFGSPAVRVDEEWIYGPGVSDCKGGIVAGFMAMDALEQCGFKSRPVQMILQSDEETSSKGSNKKTIEFMVEKAKGSVAFLNTEPATTGQLCVTRKGILRYRFHIHGKAVHSAGCYDGANAIAEAAHKLLKLEEMKDAKGLTCNCGVISGGTVANTVAAECSFTADIRFADQTQYEEVVQLCRRLAEHSTIPGCTCDLEEVSYRPSMPLEDRNVKLLEEVNRIYEECGLPVMLPENRRGGADSAYTTQAGIPTLDGFGVDGKREHSVEEKAPLSELPAAAKRLATVVYCI